MEYNTQQRTLPLPEYGRSVQNMVDHALTIEDRAERQRCANTIINIMGGMFPHLRDVPDFKHKLWDHLAIMADFKLDIDYPYEIVKKESLEVKPDMLPYPHNGIRYRHYGRILENMIKKAVDYPEGEEKKQLICATSFFSLHRPAICWASWVFARWLVHPSKSRNRRKDTTALQYHMHFFLFCIRIRNI